MTSIGNDIIDLSAVNRQRSVDARFYLKFITSAEQALYTQTVANRLSLETFVWLLWSVKESVYKSQKRHRPDLVFSPTKITVTKINIPVTPVRAGMINNQCEITAPHDCLYSGEAIADNGVLHYRSVIQTGFIATVVNSDALFNNIHWGVMFIGSAKYQAQSASVRSFVLSKLQHLFAGCTFAVTKSKTGYPIILQNGEQAPFLLSLSHHNLYTSYSLKITV